MPSSEIYIDAPVIVKVELALLTAVPECEIRIFGAFLFESKHLSLLLSSSESGIFYAQPNPTLKPVTVELNLTFAILLGPS